MVLANLVKRRICQSGGSLQSVLMCFRLLLLSPSKTTGIISSDEEPVLYTKCLVNRICRGSYHYSFYRVEKRVQLCHVSLAMMPILKIAGTALRLSPAYIHSVGMADGSLAVFPPLGEVNCEHRYIVYSGELAMHESSSRRGFLQSVSLASVATAGLTSLAHAGELKTENARKLRVGIVGYGVCRFGAAFGFQDHPDVEVVAVSDLFPDRCQQLAQACRCEKTYPSLEQMVKDDGIDAIFLATDAPSHAQHAVEVLKHGKHVACAVPAVYGSLEDADRLYETVKRTRLKYMMFETSYFHDDCYAMRQIYNDGGFGKLVYTEGEYYHHFPTALASYKDWREGLPPLWYPTHSTAYYVGVSGGSFTDVSCMGFRSEIPHLRADGNRYKNPFGTEVALFRTSEGGTARMTCSWDTPGHGGESGRVRGQQGSMTGMSFQGRKRKQPNIERPPLPRGLSGGGHGGSHGHLCHEFVSAIGENRQPLVDISAALNMTVSGIVAHQSALKDGQLMKIPQYSPVHTA